MTQKVRASQFIFSFGPGAILEARNQTRVILNIEYGLIHAIKDPEDFELSNVQLSMLLGTGARVFRIPTNAELDLSENKYIWRTKRFPDWRLCTESHTEGGTRFHVLYRYYRGGSPTCPVCKQHGKTGRQHDKSDAIRFVLSCPAGHMDDVNWPELVHGTNHSCMNTSWFRWKGSGGSLKRIFIECPLCSRNANLGEAFNRTWLCTGRYPEDENVGSDPIRRGCTKDAVMVQKGASYLRIPEVLTLFSIATLTELDKILQQAVIRGAVAAMKKVNEQEFKGTITRLAKKELISQTAESIILEHAWKEIESSLHKLESPPQTFEEELLEEFHTFIRGSKEGIPPEARLRENERILFEINRHEVRNATLQNGTTFRVVPVQHLTVIAIQKGYKRWVYSRHKETGSKAEEPPLKEIYYCSRGEKWYPGVEFSGEGVFVLLDEQDGWSQRLIGKSVERWQKVVEVAGQYTQSVFRSSRPDELDPCFVWWHTLSHALIRQISLESGYPHPSIRERVYFERDTRNNRTRGGIVIYSAGPESESALGGLVSLSRAFGDVLQRAIDSLRICSNDPLCVENAISPGQYAGAACYACVFLSETSCEHRNMWLDRNLILENMP